MPKDPYDDPNRTLERVERLLSLAASALEEAEGIASGAEADGAPRHVRMAVQAAIENWLEENT